VQSAAPPAVYDGWLAKLLIAAILSGADASHLRPQALDRWRSGLKRPLQPLAEPASRRPRRENQHVAQKCRGDELINTP